jgi:hypothetical protein
LHQFFKGFTIAIDGGPLHPSAAARGVSATRHLFLRRPMSTRVPARQERPPRPAFAPLPGRRRRRDQVRGLDRRHTRSSTRATSAPARATPAPGCSAPTVSGRRSPRRSGEAERAYAVQLYSDATKVDDDPSNYPPTDTGSDGLSIAQVLKARGLISGYTHITSLPLRTPRSRPARSSPARTGTTTCSTPTNGLVKIGGGVAGGHEYESSPTTRRRASGSSRTPGARAGALPATPT